MTFFMFSSSDFNSLSSPLYSLIVCYIIITNQGGQLTQLLPYSSISPCFSFYTYSNYSDNFLARDSSSFLSWMCYYSSLLIFSHSFSASSFSFTSFLLSFLRLLSSFYSCMCLSDSSSLETFVLMYLCFSSSYNLSAQAFSYKDSSSYFYNFWDSFFRPSTQVQTS